MPRFRLRTLMIVVVVFGIAAALVVFQKRRERYLAKSTSHGALASEYAQFRGDEAEYAEYHDRLRRSYEEAANHPWQKAPEEPPPYDSYMRAHYWIKKGDYAKSIKDLSLCMSESPFDLEASCDLAWILAACPDPKYRNGRHAVEIALDASRHLSDARCMDILAAAYAEAGEFAEAVRAEQTAISFLPSDAPRLREKHAVQFRERLKLYNAGKPYHDPPGTWKRP